MPLAVVFNSWLEDLKKRSRNLSAATPCSLREPLHIRGLPKKRRRTEVFVTSLLAALMPSAGAKSPQKLVRIAGANGIRLWYVRALIVASVLNPSDNPKGKHNESV